MMDAKYEERREEDNREPDWERDNNHIGEA